MSRPAGLKGLGNWNLLAFILFHVGEGGVENKKTKTPPLSAMLPLPHFVHLFSIYGARTFF